MKVDVNKYITILKNNSIIYVKKDVDYIVKHLENNSFEHIVYEYPNKNYIASVIKYYEEKEDYEKCSKIVKFISSHNKLNGVNVKTVL